MIDQPQTKFYRYRSQLNSIKNSSLIQVTVKSIVLYGLHTNKQTDKETHGSTDG